MKTSKQIILLSAMLLAASLGTARGDVVVLQSLNPLAPGEFSNLGPSNQQVADDFSLAQATTLESISWIGRYGSAAVGAPDPTGFSLRFFEDSGNAPTLTPFLVLDIIAAPVASGFEYGSVTGAPGIPWYSYSASLPAVTLDSATYWLSVVESDPSTAMAGSTQWLWADADTAGLRAIRGNDSEAWSAALDTDHAFSLSGTVVPVPAAFWLFGTALAGLAGFKARRKTVA